MSARLAAPRCAMMVLMAVVGTATVASANVPPNTPVITEPATDGRVLNAEDVHMETGSFTDPDAADTHVCSDWEIWSLVGNVATGALQERAWFASCTGGIELLHVHLGDGAFQGSYAGRRALLPNTFYKLRVRHRDSSGEGATEWSAFGERAFSTGAGSSVFPLDLDDVSPTPTPTLTDTFGVPIALPGGTTPASLRLETGAGGLLLQVDGSGAGNVITNPPTLGLHLPVRVRAIAGTSAYAQPAANLSFTDDTGAARTIYLPAFNLAAGTSAYYWISGNGSSYIGAAGQTTPDFTTLARGAAVPWTVRAPGFVVETVATGFQLPVSIAFVPSPGPAADAPLYYVAELYGTIKLVRRNGVVSNYATNLINFNPTGAFPGSGEQGLASICVNPANGDLYATMLYDSAPPNGAHFPKVVRFTSSNGGLTAATQTTILDMVNEPQGQSHQISNITIGPDGKLYVHMGDGFVASTAQNLDSFRGKILRLNLDGTAPNDNPNYSVVDGINSRDYVWASGVRNAFGGAWRASDNSHYMVENGPSVDRLTKLVRARNYLWDGSDASMANFALYNWNPSSGPVNIAFIQSQTFGGSGFPATFYGRGFVTESGATWGTGPQTIGKKISYFFIDATGGTATPPVTLVEYNGSGKATTAGIAAGPDGLYFTDLYKDVGYVSPIDAGANVMRIRFVGEAAFVATPTTATVAPLNVSFTDTSNVVGASAWHWSFGDGGTSHDRHPSHTYTAPGKYTVRLTVTGTNGPVVTQRNELIRIGQTRPLAFIVGNPELGTGDAAVLSHLSSLGLEVVVYDDAAAARPSAAVLAQDHDAVLVSSTITAANVGGEFRTANVPLIFWESALLQTAREPLSDAGSEQGNQTQINITNATHPVMRGLAAGATSVFTGNRSMSVATNPVAPGATVLATRTANAAHSAVVVAESGAALLGGYVAPARRVFLFLQDTSFTAATPAGRTIVGNAACWAAGWTPAVTNNPLNQMIPAGQMATFSVSSTGAINRTYQWRRNNVNITNGGRFAGATSPTLTIADVGPADVAGYDVVISTIGCGSVTSAAAMLSLGTACPSDFNQSGSTTVQDIFDFLVAYFAGDPRADVNNIGGVTVQDIFDFLAFYFQGC